MSGGKRLGGKSKRTSNNAASALRMVASTLHSSDSALGAFFCRLKFRLGARKATTAAAHKIASIIFQMIKNHIELQKILVRVKRNCFLINNREVLWEL